MNNGFSLVAVCLYLAIASSSFVLVAVCFGQFTKAKARIERAVLLQKQRAVFAKISRELQCATLVTRHDERRWSISLGQGEVVIDYQLCRQKLYQRKGGDVVVLINGIDEFLISKTNDDFFITYQCGSEKGLVCVPLGATAALYRL